MMLLIAVEVAGAVCGTDCSMFSQTADCLPTLNSLSKSGRSGGQKPHHLLWLRNASMRWWSVTMVNPLHTGDAYVSQDTTTTRKMVLCNHSKQKIC